MRISRKQVYFLLTGIMYGSVNTGAICYGWYLLDKASSPQAIIDSSQGGETIVRYVNGKAMELIFKPVPPEKVKK
jgi:hypothetical protein